MRRALFGLILAMSATAVAADPRIEPNMSTDTQIASSDIELAPIVIQERASFMRAIVVDVDISTIEIFEI